MGTKFLYSSVIGFTHKDSEQVSDFVKIIAGGNVSVELTAGHYLFVNDELIQAKYVKKGDSVVYKNGKKITVNGVYLTRNKGLYNPQTSHGDIVVNSILTQ